LLSQQSLLRQFLVKQELKIGESTTVIKDSVIVEKTKIPAEVSKDSVVNENP